MPLGRKLACSSLSECLLNLAISSITFLSSFLTLACMLSTYSVLASSSRWRPKNVLEVLHDWRIIDRQWGSCDVVFRLLLLASTCWHWSWAISATHPLMECCCCRDYQFVYWMSCGLISKLVGLRKFGGDCMVKVMNITRIARRGNLINFCRRQRK